MTPSATKTTESTESADVPETPAKLDRAAAVRRALRALVAEHGFHGASMGAVAKAAGVATGTAYVHYASKDDLVYATYLEVKRELGAAAVRRVDRSGSPREQFLQLWRGIHDHLAAEPERARFLVQVDVSPYAHTAHAMGMAVGDDPLIAAAATDEMLSALAPLPLEVLYDLGLGPAVRLVASGYELTRLHPALDLDAIAEACWRAISA